MLTYLRRFTFVGAVLAAAALSPSTATAQRAYDLEQLHPDVRDAAMAAREADAPAQLAAVRAREAEERAEIAARRARNFEEGYGTSARDLDPQQRRFEGQRAAYDEEEGVGILSFGAGPFAGDRYIGEFSCGYKHGFGVYRYASMPDDRGEPRFEGTYARDSRAGLGIYIARDGARYVGEVDSSGMNGVGAHSSANGWRYEGQFANNRPNGFGVLWNERGRVQRSGIFRNARLVTPLTQRDPAQRVIRAERPEPPADRLSCVEGAILGDRFMPPPIESAIPRSAPVN